MNPNDELTVAHTPAPPEFPRPFGKYELLDRIGAGGMGCVYRARRINGDDDTVVALKTPLPELMDHAPARERFYREYQALARFRHPGLAPVLDFGRHEDAYYFAMAYIEGTPLDKLCVTDQMAAARIARDIADAIGHAHDAGIVHRDIKPQNVIVRPDGRVVVVDFGIAMLTERAGDPDRPTQEGAPIGTPRYMPPEQIAGDIAATGPHSDIYSLGVVLYWMLTGRLPFEGTLKELMYKIIMDPPPAPETFAPWLDPRLSAAALRAMQKKPAERFPSMAAFAADLNAVLDPTPAAPGTARAVKYDFVPVGFDATDAAGRGRLYLDVGNDLRPGVIDHHHGSGLAASATRLVTLRPELVRAAADGSDTVSVVLHESPDLDCAAASYLATALLTRGALPAGAAALADYLDRVDGGATMFTLYKPYTLYAAYMVLARRLMNEMPDARARWDALVRGGHRLIEHALSVGGPIAQVNAFDSPVMTRADRAELLDDAQRYEKKLTDPQARARRAVLALPTAWGGRQAVEALIVRDVQTEGDPDRCSFFKDWARTDSNRCPNTDGFVVLCVWMSRPRPRCIISVRPDSDAKLIGLGELLDAAETAARAATGQERTGPPRRGYSNSDPWYDGRAHHDTIVDAPRAGTALSADAVERILLEYGNGTARPLAN